MTYFGFLAIFLALPLGILALLTWRDIRQGRRLPDALNAFPFAFTLLAHVVLALVYTTPWDNYLVATGVWYYNPALVTGITLGWVPLEEYCFFILQTLLTGLWLLFLAKRLTPPATFRASSRLRLVATALVGTIWLASVGMLLADWSPGVYLGLILAWALPPIALQLFFGADILWHHRRLVGLTLVSAVLYLAAVDSLAIGSGTWTIDPAQSFNLFLGGTLPVEEFIFFLMTNTLIVFGVVLVQAQQSQARVRAWRRGLSG